MSYVIMGTLGDSSDQNLVLPFKSFIISSLACLRYSFLTPSRIQINSGFPSSLPVTSTSFHTSKSVIGGAAEACAAEVLEDGDLTRLVSYIRASHSRIQCSTLYHSWPGPDSMRMRAVVLKKKQGGNLRGQSGDQCQLSI